MQRRFIIGVMLAISVLMLLTFSYPAEAAEKLEIPAEINALLPKDTTAPPFPPTEVHTALTKDKEWLNVARPLDANDLAGRIILLDFWTFCCINCIQSMPDLHYLEEKFGSALTVIGVHSAKFNNEKDSENIRQAILRYDLQHPVINDADFSVWKAFMARGWPTFILLDPRGKVVSTYYGEGHRAELERDIQMQYELFGSKLKKLVTRLLPLALEKDKSPVAILNFPGKLTTIPDFNGKPALAISDSGNHRVLIADLKGNIVNTFGSGSAGFTDGNSGKAQFNTPQGLAYNDGFLYVADTNNHALRSIDVQSGDVSTLAGTGTKGSLRRSQDAMAKYIELASPWDVAFYPDKQHLVVAMAGSHQLWRYNFQTQDMQAIAGNGGEGLTDGGFPFNILAQPSGLTTLGDALYFVDAETSSLRKVSADKNRVSTLIGKGLFDFGYIEGRKDKARMQHPLGLYADDTGIYIADAYNHAIRRYDVVTETLSNFAGTGHYGMSNGDRASAEFNEPNDIERIGDTLYVADTNNHRIRTISLKSGTVGELPVMPMPRDDTPTFSDFLPNVELMSTAQIIADKPTTLTLGLKKGWKLNRDAPSYLALFDADHTLLQFFDKDDLRKGRVTLEALSSPSARLQGTFYYCEEKEGAICLIKSFDGTVTADPEATTTTITLPLQQ